MAFYEKQKRKQVTSGYKIKMSGLHHGLLGEEVSPMCPVQTVTHVSGRSEFKELTAENR
jgi:hypothetical protein